MFSDLSELSGVEAASDPDTSLQVRNDNIIDVSYEYEYPEFIEAIKDTDDCKPDETVKDYYNRIFDKYIENSKSLLASIRRIKDTVEDDFNDTLLRKVWEHLAKDSETPYDNQKLPLERVVENLKCNEVTEQWPSNQRKRRRRGKRQETPEDKAWREALEDVTEQDFKLLTVYARLNRKINNSQTMTRNTVKERYTPEQFKTALNEAQTRKTEEQKVSENLIVTFDSYRNDKKTIKDDVLPDLQLISTRNPNNETYMKKDVTGNLADNRPKFNSFQDFYLVGEDDYILYHKDTVDLIEKTDVSRYTIKNEDGKSTIKSKKNDDTVFDLQTVPEGLSYATEKNSKFEKYVQTQEKNNYDFLKVQLNAEQQFAVDKMKDSVLIFHDPGVGKTINALAVAVNIVFKNNGKFLIHVIAPSSQILSQWKYEFEKR